MSVAEAPEFWHRQLRAGDVINVMAIGPVLHGETFIVMADSLAPAFLFPACKPHKRKQTTLLLIPLQKRFAAFRFKDHG